MDFLLFWSEIEYKFWPFWSQIHNYGFLHSTILDKINRNNKSPPPPPKKKNNDEGTWGAKRTILASLKFGERGSTEVPFILSYCKIAILNLVYPFLEEAAVFVKKLPVTQKKFCFLEFLYLVWYKYMPIVQQSKISKHFYAILCT